MMKRLITVMAYASLILSCKTGKEGYLFTSFREPANEGLRLLYSYDGYHWTDFNKTFLSPAIGSKVMRDPSMVRSSDGKFHLVWTCAWKGDRGFGYASSSDLIGWSEQRFIPVMQHEDSVVNVWAPEIFHDEDRRQFVIVWASTIPHLFPRGEEDEYNNHRLYYTITKDFNEFSPSKLLYDPGFSSIDAVMLKNNNDYVQVVKDNTRPNRNLKITFSTNPLGPFEPTSQSFTETFVEGPAVVKVKEDWLIYFDMYRKKMYGAVKTKDFKSFVDITRNVSLPKGHKHGTIVPVTKKFLKNLKKKIH